METRKQLVEIGMQMGYKDDELQKFVEEEQNRARDERERERVERREREEKEMQWRHEKEELAVREHKRKLELLQMERREEKVKNGKVMKYVLKDKVSQKTSRKNCPRSFYRRNETLVQKANELHVATGARVQIAVTSPTGVRYSFSSNKEQNIVHEENNKEELSIDIPSTSTSPPTFSPKDKVDAFMQTDTVEWSGNEVECRVCFEKKLDTRSLWVGCSHPKCNYWCHAKCIGIMAKTQAPLSRIKYVCPQHRL